MGKAFTIVYTSLSEQIRRAIQKVNKTPKLRNECGLKVLWALYNAPDHTMLQSELSEQFEGALDLHFGWFCRRVAEELGVSKPDAFALVDYSTDQTGAQVLTVKRSVTAALGIKARA